MAREGPGVTTAAPAPARARFGLRSAVVLVAALLTAAGTLRLGVWQLDRADQKLALQAALDTRAGLPPLPQADLATTLPAAAAQHHRRITLRGEWLPQATVFLDNRQMNARPGFFVLTPLRLVMPSAQGPAPAGAPTVVWVQRGWVARDNNERTRLPAVPTPPGEVSLTGRVAPAPARLYQLGADPGGPIRQNLDLDASARDLGLGIFPLTVVQTEPASGPADGLLRDWAPPAVDVQKHFGYAFQWFALSALVTGLYVWYQLLRPRRRHGR